MYPSPFALYLAAVNVSAGVGAAAISSLAAARLSASRWSVGVLAKDIIAALAVMLAAVALAVLLAAAHSEVLALDAWHFIAFAVVGVALRQLWTRRSRSVSGR
jgi:hypothetical protein